jgi:hypothetical protein
MRSTILHGTSAIVTASSSGVIVTIEEAVLPDAVKPAEPAAPADATSIYATVAEYAKHRGLCAKTIRKFVPVLPHSTVGGIRIRRQEADDVLDNLKSAPRKRRKASK